MSDELLEDFSFRVNAYLILFGRVKPWSLLPGLLIDGTKIQALTER